MRERGGAAVGGGAAVVVMTALVAMGGALPANAAIVPAASCPGPRDQPFAFSNPPGGNARAAQTFVVQQGGTLVQAQVDVAKAPGSSGDYIVQILQLDGAGAPSNAVVAQATVPNSTVPNGNSLITGTFGTAVPVTPGQSYAVVLTRPGSADLGMGLRNGDDCAGGHFSSGGQAPAPFTAQPSNFDLVFTVFVDDGLVDSPPETTITKGPKSKTKKKQATFEFASSEPGSTFACAVDDQVLKVPCTSPYTVKVKKGKHTFQVRATDAGGNVDGSPATDTWKVKKKRKK